MSVGYLGTLLLAAVGMGWWAGRRAPDGIEYRLWLRFTRRTNRAMRAINSLTSETKR